MQGITMTLFLLLRCQHGLEKRYMNLTNPSTWQAVASAQTGQVCQGTMEMERGIPPQEDGI